METCEDRKRRLILDAAAKLFADKRFDEVKLDDIACAAQLGKGTIYLYFKSKEALYSGLLIDGLESLLREVRQEREIPGRGVWEELEGIVDAMLRFARKNPQLYGLMRAGIPCCGSERLSELREQVVRECADAITRGVEQGVLVDPHPELTGQYLLSFVRVAILYAPANIEPTALRQHILRVLGHGIRAHGANNENTDGSGERSR